eukprot:TRINITY_DN12821_c0_g1_i2.p1 TRINITY_DN12821_c0_g1~~TRINITY_DN12821_c0_g1_i2.p1  ORF type:complete len:116 (+),score=15.99 TRINITY_DN12821_c0_g1_i2:72-419(+)
MFRSWIPNWRSSPSKKSSERPRNADEKRTYNLTNHRGVIFDLYTRALPPELARHLMKTQPFTVDLAADAVNNLFNENYYQYDPSLRNVAWFGVEADSYTNMKAILSRIPDGGAFY